MTTIKVGSKDAYGFHPNGDIVDPDAIDQFIGTKYAQKPIAPSDLPTYLGQGALNGVYATQAAVNANTTALAGKLDKTEASTTYVQKSSLPVPNTAIIFGTSITNQNSATGGSQFEFGTTAKGYWAQAQVQLGHRLKTLRNAGISGNNSAQMLARITTDVLNYQPGWCIVESGTPNDIGNGFTLAQTIANHKAIYDQLKAKNIRVVVCTPLPYGLNDSAANRQFVAGFRKWQISYARQNGFIICDWLPVLSASDGTGLFKPNYSDGVDANKANGIHPTSAAALAMGTVLANALKPFVPDAFGLWLPGSNADPYNLLTNGMMTGTTGSVMPTGVTGSLATGWSAYNNGGTSGGTLSKVARTDGVAGEWQQFTASSTNADIFKMQQQNTAVGTAWNVGDSILAIAEFQTDPGWVGTNLGIGLQLYWTGNGGSVNDLTQPSGEVYMGQPPTNGILKVVGTIPTGTTRLQINPQSFLMGGGTIRWGRIGLYNLTTLNALGITAP